MHSLVDAAKAGIEIGYRSVVRLFRISVSPVSKEETLPAVSVSVRFRPIADTTSAV
jgi:hypothetical protein